MPVSSAPQPYPSPGDVVESWLIEEVLGEGGMGCVTRARHTVLQTPVAIKFMNPQFMGVAGAVDRFINEGRASSVIKSDHVVPVIHAGKLDNGTPYLVMECLDGQDLEALLKREGTPGLPVTRALHFVLQALRALQAAHALGIIHRDMKPSNCFVVNKEGEEDFVKVLDFGISKVNEPGSAALTRTNSTLGTPLYMAPEQARDARSVDGRSDIYSVGVILYELLTGQTPHVSETGEFADLLYKLFTQEPRSIQDLRPDLPRPLAAIIHKALARDREERFASAVEMALALQPYAGPQSVQLIGRMLSSGPPRGRSDAHDLYAAATQLGAPRAALAPEMGHAVSIREEQKDGPQNDASQAVAARSLEIAPTQVRAADTTDAASAAVVPLHSSDPAPGASSKVSGAGGIEAAPPRGASQESIPAAPPSPAMMVGRQDSIVNQDESNHGVAAHTSAEQPMGFRKEPSDPRVWRNWKWAGVVVALLAGVGLLLLLAPGSPPDDSETASGERASGAHSGSEQAPRPEEPKPQAEPIPEERPVAPNSPAAAADSCPDSSACLPAPAKPDPEGTSRKDVPPSRTAAPQNPSRQHPAPAPPPKPIDPGFDPGIR